MIKLREREKCLRILPGQLDEGFRIPHEFFSSKERKRSCQDPQINSTHTDSHKKSLFTIAYFFQKKKVSNPDTGHGLGWGRRKGNSMLLLAFFNSPHPAGLSFFFLSW